MRSPQNVLESLSSKACNSNYRYQRLYRNLYNPEFYLIAYQKIQAKQGNMTAGTDGKTVDGIGMKRINALIARLKDFSYPRHLGHHIQSRSKLLPRTDRHLPVAGRRCSRAEGHGQFCGYFRRQLLRAGRGLGRGERHYRRCWQWSVRPQLHLHPRPDRDLPVSLHEVSDPLSQQTPAAKRLPPRNRREPLLVTVKP